jgi:hypothetical protein
MALAQECLTRLSFESAADASDGRLDHVYLTKEQVQGTRTTEKGRKGTGIDSLAFNLSLLAFILRPGWAWTSHE